MHDEATDARTQAFLDEVRQSFQVTTPPSPGPELASLFVTGLVNDNGDLPATAASNATRSAPQMSGLPNWTRRQLTMTKDLLSQLRVRAGAAALGAALAVGLGGLGATGAITGPANLIGHLTSDDHEECVSDDVNDDDPVCDDAELTGTDGGTPTPMVEPGDLPDAPTSVSEAAQTHAFDEACGNHGMYVSFFAQMGFEPPCATSVREGTYDPAGSTRQERKKAALEYRKHCKAQLKAGTPCDPAGPADSDDGQVVPEEEPAETSALDDDGDKQAEKKAKSKADKAKGKKAGNGAHGR